MACPEPPAVVTCWQLDEREHGNLRAPTLLVLLDEPVLKTNRCIAVTELGGVVRRAVERDQCVDSELAIGDETIIQFHPWQAARSTVAHNHPGRKCVALVVTERGGFRIVGAVGGSSIRGWGCQAPKHN